MALAIVSLVSLGLYWTVALRSGCPFRTVDGYLYYAHARSWYFDHDCDYDNDYRMAPGFEVRDQYRQIRSAKGRVVDFWPCGWSLLALPFLALSDGLTILHNSLGGPQLPRDGYSAYYSMIVPLGHLLVGILGLLAAYSLLARYFRATIAASAVIFVWAGTNVLYYTSINPTMAHAASLALVAMMAWTVDTIRRTEWTTSHAIALGIVSGLLVSVRPPDGVWLTVPAIVLLPPLIVELRYGRPRAVRHVLLAALAGLVAAVCVVPQIAVNIVNEGAVFGMIRDFIPQGTHPTLLGEIIGRPAGLLRAYPLVGVSLLGVASLILRERQRALPAALLTGFLLLWCLNADWSYARGTPRRYAAGMVLFAFGLAAVLEWAARSTGRLTVLASLLVAFCIRSTVLAFGPVDSWG